ncbi:glucoamylase [Halonotius terrestris]|uniref:Glucoamylase n=1 Tax=Halonotius terrestris TaxID=2487750 RepID=A0A8J8PAL6_9EURY|nr:glycoside hydrolase family 15 protein [Halonotius terrestris]TQQ79740.1 glucoamylase [Halonotius terrestris]
MRLRTALNEYKRNDGGRFPAECRTTDGAFSAHGDRLVYVGPDGSLRDYSSALSGLYGIDRARLGIETSKGTQWFDEFSTVRQHYYRETNVVETEYAADGFTVHQYDLTLGRAHVTHIELRGSIPPNAELTAFLTFAPGGQESKVGRLIHEHAGPNETNAVEVFHRTEHDYVTASTGITDVRGQIPERFDEILSDEAFEFPREAVINRFEDTHLSGDVVVNAPLEQTGRAAKTTLVTQLSDHSKVDREEALGDLCQCAEAHGTADDIRRAGRERAEVSVPDSAPNGNVVREDLRALALLTAPTGSHIAAPEFDPFYAHSGGYGYTWFRDEAETGRNLLTADDSLDLGLQDRLVQTAEFFCRSQEPDGSWTHRVWAIDGSLAPGWAHGRIEGHDEDYQADQTASVLTYLAELLTKRGDALDDELGERIRETIHSGIEVLDETLEDDGLPEQCQNLWENMNGRFTHTAATYLGAYATIAAAPVDDGLREHAHGQAETVFEGFDRLWSETREAYGIRLNNSGKLDDRIDSGTFAVVDAMVAYDRLTDDDLSEKTVDRLFDHVQSLFDALYREPAESDVAGLARFEGDTWRSEGQHGEKIWSVSTAWGSTAATDLGVLLKEYDREEDAKECFEQAGTLYEHLLPDGPLATEAGYLAEQVFDDGSVDSAAPLGWSHSLRLRATATLREQNSLPLSSPAPSGPEGRPRWTTGEKYGVATVADHGESDASKVWFTLTEGALTEVRFPRVDLMNLRTADFVIADAAEDSTYTARTHNETRRDDDTDTVERRVEPTEDDALLFRHVVTERGDGRGHEWTLSVEYAIDPDHDAIVADVEFESADKKEYDVYAVADISLTNTGTRDRGYRLGERGNYHLAARDAEAYDTGAEALLTDEDGDVYSVAMAMTTTGRFDWATVGAAGSPHLAELFSEGKRPHPNDRLDDDNIVLAGRIGTGETVSDTLALGFGENADTAAALGEAEGALATPYEEVRESYAETWRAFLSDKEIPQFIIDDDELYKQYKSCLMALRAVEDKTYLGAGIASPSVPWGEAVTADEPKGYGYNFVWSRDLYQVFTVFEAIGDHKTATDALQYIYEYQQDEEGFIPQNTYVNGLTRWGGEQIDNISFPQVMAYQLAENGIEFDDVNYDYINVKRSADYVARNGPATAQERWEEEAGYSPSSIAAEVAGLVCAADIAIDQGETADALVWLALADEWTVKVEDWCATKTGTELHTNTPYYVRVTRDGNPEAGHLRTLANAGPTLDEREIIDGGFLELTRLGIKPADDDVIENSITEVDNTIRIDTPQGPAFYRYNGDGYGERAMGEKGAPWSVQTKGKGRLWPIFTGERGEYELLAGTDEGELAPYNLLKTMAGFANSGRMIAEQVWDRHIDNEYNWEMGEGTGAATPLAWSMAQFIRLAHGIDAGEPVETPEVVDQRYRGEPRPEEPTLDIETTTTTTKKQRGSKEETLTISGESDGELVAVKASADAAVTTVEDGEFEVTLPIGHGERTVTLAAASEADLSTAGTTVEQVTI